MKKVILMFASLALAACGGASSWIQNKSGAPAKFDGKEKQPGQCYEVEDADDFPVKVTVAGAEGQEDQAMGEVKMGDDDEGTHYIWDGTQQSKVADSDAEDFANKCKNWSAPAAETPEDAAAKAAVEAVTGATQALEAKTKEIMDANATINVGPGPGVPAEEKAKAEAAKKAAIESLPAAIEAAKSAISAAEAAAATEGVTAETQTASNDAVEKAKAAVTAAESHLPAS